MKARILLVILYLIALSPLADAQAGLINGGLEAWRRRQFRCCGRNVDLPVDWGTPEQSCGINYNKFVFLEEDPYNVHSGLCAAKLYSDTTTFNNVVLEPGILIYGGYPNILDSSITIGQRIEDKNSGLGIDSMPLGLTFWIKMSHNVADTFSYTYLFTRWDSGAHTQDTLAYYTKDIPDSQVPMDQWVSISDSIRYRHMGQADTVRVFFYGGRAGDPALLGSTTWIDDISFDRQYPKASVTGVMEQTIEPFSLFPNPVSGTLHIRDQDYQSGHSLEICDDLGRTVAQVPISSGTSEINTGQLSSGYYVCRILDAHRRSLYQSRLTILK